MKTPTGPTFRSLTRAECDVLLARNHVGRIAFSFHDRVNIQPISYVFEAGWLFGRTSEGHMLATLEHNRWIAFEVDEARGPFDWASVVVQGSFHQIDPEGTTYDQAAAQRAVHLLRSLVPESFTPDDPAAFRTVLFRISIGEMTGRAASPGVSAEPAAVSDRRAPTEASRTAPPPASP